MNLRTILSVLFRVILPVLVGLVFLVGVIAWLSGVFTEKIAPGRTATVAARTLPPGAETSDVHEITQPYVAEAIGTLKAANRTEIAARVMARITDVHVKAGDTVERGDELVLLDPRDFQAKVNQAQAAATAAQAALQQAQQDYDTDAELIREKVIAQTRFDQTTTALNIAKAKVDQANQTVAEAKVMLQYTTIQAPLPGTVVDRLAEPGDLASPGIPLIVLYDPSSLRLEVPVMENLAGKLRPGDELTVQIEALGNEKVTATVDEIVPQAQAASRSFLVKVKLPKVPGAFEGLFGKLLIPAGERRHLCLDQRAVQTIGQLQFVEVVRDDETLERRFVKLGREGMPGRVEVISGLEPNETVLLQPAAGTDPQAGKEASND